MITSREVPTRPHPINNSHKSLQYRGKTKRSVASGSGNHHAYIHKITWMIKPNAAILKLHIASAT